MHPLQEKFQITVPQKEETADNEAWAWPMRGNTKVRDTHGVEQMHSNNSTAGEFASDKKYNQLPPGMDLANQLRPPQFNNKYTIGGRSDVRNSRSNLEGPEAMERGFTRIEMKGTDDQYTGEHVDHFYGDSGGFAERNNYLDRE